MQSGARAALAAARRVAQQSQGQQVPCMSLTATRGFSSTSAAAASSRVVAIHQPDVTPVQQLISLRRHFSASTTTVPGAVPGTGGGAAEKQTGAGSGAAGIAEGSTGAATGPAAGGAEVSTGLGTPGQSAPAEAGSGLRDPTDTPPAEQHEGTAPADAGASAERTADPSQPPEGAAEAGASQQQAPEPPGGSEHQADPDTAAAGGAGSGGGVSEPGAESSGGDSSSSPEQPGPGDGPVKAEAEDESGMMHWVVDTVQDLSGQLSVRIMRRLVESEFDEEEFLESAKDAYYIVNELFANQDFDTLAPMVSEKLLDAFRGTHEDYQRQGYTFQLAKQTVDDATITEVLTLPKETIAKLDPPLGALAPDVDPPMAAGSGAVAAAAAVASQNATVETDWRARLKGTTSRLTASEPFLVIGVRFRGEQELETRAKEDGKLLSLLKDKRSHIWRFVRGPLPQTDLPRRRLDLPWKLLDVVT